MSIVRAGFVSCKGCRSGIYYTPEQSAYALGCCLSCLAHISPEREKAYVRKYLPKLRKERKP